MVEMVDSEDLGDVTLVKGFAPSSLRTFFGKSRLACFYKRGSSVTLRLGFLTVSKSEDSKIATGFSVTHICGRGGIGRLDGFRFRYLSGVRVRVPPPAPEKCPTQFEQAEETCELGGAFYAVKTWA